MVSPRPGESGKSRLGCLFSVFVLAVAFIFGIRFFEVYFRYYRIQDQVRTQASFAPSLTDDVIRRRLVAASDSLGLPIGPRDWDIRRSLQPREMLIHAEYDDSVMIELPGFRKVFRFHFSQDAHVPL